jgi:hypothetical protein
MLVGFIIFLFTYTFRVKKDMKLIADFTSPSTYAPTGIVGAALLFVGIHFFTLASESLDRISILKEYGTASARLEANTERILLILAIAVGLLALLSAVHFVLCALIENGISFGRANFGLVTVAFLSLYAIYLYFDNSAPVNNPDKILNELAYLFAAVFFLYETRLSIGRERWRGYIAFGFIAALISAYSSIPSLIYYFANGGEISRSIYEMILSSAIFIFASARILLTAELIEDTESEFAMIFKAASEERSAEITPPEPTPAEPEAIESPDEALDENQLTIDDVCESDSEKDDVPSEDTPDSLPTEEAAINSEEASFDNGQFSPIANDTPSGEISNEAEARDEAPSDDGIEATVPTARENNESAEPTLTEAKDEAKNTEEQSANTDSASDNK